MKKSNSISNVLIVCLLIFSGLFSGCTKDELNSVDESLSGEADNPTELKSTVATGTFIITNRNSGKALDLNTATNDVLQYSYWGGSNQKWVLNNAGSGYYRVSPTSNTGIALDVAGQSTEENANVQAYSYWAGANQQWQFVDAGSGYYSIINRNSGKALSVYGSSTNNKGNIVQTSYTGSASQQWSLTSLSPTDGGLLTWRLTTLNVPSDIEGKISAAMDAAVARYNSWGNWDARTLTVEYNTGVPTADGSISGNIRFGANTSYMTERTALHEISHTYGVGTSSTWSYPLIQNYIFVGETAAALLKTFDGSNAVINTGGSHFWPYGLNYETEMSETAADRHVQLVWAMVQDGIY